jgi:hypothetical protein
MCWKCQSIKLADCAFAFFTRGKVPLSYFCGEGPYNTMD